MPTPKKGYIYKGERLDSVTQIISRFKDSSALLYWAFKQGKDGKESLYEERDTAAAIGTVTHKMIEVYITEGTEEFGCLCDSEPCICDKALNGFQQYLKWAESNNMKMLTKYQEIKLVCPKYKYGGTPDALATLNGEPVLLDWKTSNGVYTDYILQLAAYVNLVNNGIRLDTLEPLNIKLKPEAYLLRVSKTTPGFSYHYFGDLSLAWKQFVLLRRAYEIDKQLKHYL